jgi:hypothetical protein
VNTFLAYAAVGRCRLAQLGLDTRTLDWYDLAVIRLAEVLS